MESKGERSPKVSIYTGSKAILSGDIDSSDNIALAFGLAGTFLAIITIVATLIIHNTLGTL